MTLRATETPIAIVVAPLPPTASETATASTVDEIGELSELVTDTLPLAVSALASTQALALPLIWLSAVAPPPENPKALLEALSATVIAVAFEVAVIDVASVTATVSEPVVAVACGDVVDERLDVVVVVVAREAQPDGDRGRAAEARADGDRRGDDVRGDGGGRVGA